MTLLELMVTMVIVATLLGLGVGAFRNMSTADRVAAMRIKDALRAARQFALRESAPASVVVEPRDGVVYGLGLRTVGNWHFEDADGTGWPTPALHDPGGLLRDGVIGSALRVTEETRLSIPDLPASFDSPWGFGVDVHVRPEQAVRPMTLLERPGSWALRLDEDDALEVTVFLAAEPQVQEFRRTLPEVRLAPDRFTRLTVVCDGRVLHVAVDGVRVGDDTQFESPRRLAVVRRVPLGTGDGPTRFRGALDELRIESIVRGADDPLPEEIVLDGKAQVVHLDAFGHLDPHWHAAPVTVTFRYGEPSVRTVVEFGLLGTVRSWTEGP
ncbi:MAG: LamG-like jellyroll fold domain-containing protein [Planctomycetota bacterium]|jgi:type II secretory pathway pseudopilin PulG